MAAAPPPRSPAAGRRPEHHRRPRYSLLLPVVAAMAAAPPTAELPPPPCRRGHGGRAAAPEPRRRPRSCLLLPAIGGPFKLYDTENNVVTESKLRGNWSLMYFGYTSCPDVGPAEVQKMADAIKLLESKYGIKITPLFITIDPQRDSPAQLKAYLSEFDPRIVGLTGPISAVRQIAQEYRVFFKKVEEVGQDYLVESSHNMYLLDPCLETVRCFRVEYKASDLADAITTEVQKASASSTT